MKGIIVLLCTFFLVVTPSVKEPEVNCLTCEKHISECICDELVSKERMGATVALPAVSTIQFGSIALGAGMSISASLLYRKEKAFLLTKSRRQLGKVNIHKRRYGYLVHLPSKISGKDILLKFNDKFVIKNEGCPLYLVYKNKEYETLISSEIYINQEEEERK